MRKTILLLLFLVFCSACAASTQEDKQFELYNQLKKELIVREDMDKDIPCRISVIFNPLDNEYRYDIVIDQVQENMYDIMAVAYAHEDDQQICPTIGIFDEDTYSFCDTELEQKILISKRKGRRLSWQTKKLKL